MDSNVVTDEMELEIRRMVTELERRLLKGNPNWDFAKPRLAALIEGREYIPGEQTKPKKHDRAEKRRLEMEQFFWQRGFVGLAVPKSNVSNREFDRRGKLGQQLFFMPFGMQGDPNRFQDDYNRFMSSVGQSNHWTVTDQAERAKIGWESSKQGYWFWAEVASNTPRLNPPSSWNDLTKAIRLLSLEEYVIVWHFLKSTNIVLDVPTWNWLRTRYNGSGALDAYEYDGRVLVDRHGAGVLSVPCASIGGRSAEVV